MAQLTLPAPSMGNASVDAAVRFDFIVCVDGDCARIALFGDLDCASAPTLRRRITGLRGRFRDLVLDLTYLQFLGAAGLSVIVEAAHALAEGGTLTLLAPRESTRRLLVMVPLPGCIRIEFDQASPSLAADVLARKARSLPPR